MVSLRLRWSNFRYSIVARQPTVWMREFLRTILVSRWCAEYLTVAEVPEDYRKRRTIEAVLWTFWQHNHTVVEHVLFFNVIALLFSQFASDVFHFPDTMWSECFVFGLKLLFQRFLPWRAHWRFSSVFSYSSVVSCTLIDLFPFLILTHVSGRQKHSSDTLGLPLFEYLYPAVNFPVAGTAVDILNCHWPILWMFLVFPLLSPKSDYRALFCTHFCPNVTAMLNVLLFCQH
jgi:hypothetical protein